MLHRQRKGQRRRYRDIPFFPRNDINGNQVQGERRHSPDRRLTDVAFAVVGANSQFDGQTD
jgi:hypothetical protein